MLIDRGFFKHHNCGSRKIFWVFFLLSVLFVMYGINMTLRNSLALHRAAPLVFAMLQLVVAGDAIAQEWKTLADGQNTQTLVDLRSIQKDGAILKAVILTNYEKGSKSAILSIRCESKEYQTIAEQNFRERNRIDPITTSMTNPYIGRWLPFAMSNNVTAHVVPFLCNEAPQIAEPNDQGRSTGQAAVAAKEPLSEDLLSKGLWQDSKTGLIWSRCLVGQSWTGAKCTGEASTPKFHFKVSPENPNRVLGVDVEQNAVDMIREFKKFQLGGFGDWRLPTISELQKLLPCQDGQLIPEEAWESLDFKCPNGFIPNLDTQIFQGAAAEAYRMAHRPISTPTSKSPPRNCNRGCYSLRWIAAYIDSNGKVNWKGGVGLPILAVRSDTPLQEWVSILATADAQIRRDEREAAERIAKAEAEARDRTKRQQAEAEALAKRQETEAIATARKQEAEERAFAALLSKKTDPQALYLRAGKLERENDVAKARRVYEFLVESFSNTSWAVKANDRLLQLSKSDGNSSPRSSGQQAASSADGCSRYYSGYAGQVDYIVRGGRRTIWGERIDQYVYGKFIVVGSGNGNVTIKATSDGSFLSGNEIQQFSCARLLELENLREIPR